MRPLAERQGFEPWEPFRGSTVFETVPFDHSGTSPCMCGGVIYEALAGQARGVLPIAFTHGDFHCPRPQMA